MRRALLIGGSLAALVAGGFACFVCGAIVGQDQIYRRATDEKLAKIRPMLAADPRFARVRADYSSAAPGLSARDGPFGGGAESPRRAIAIPLWRR